MQKIDTKEADKLLNEIVPIWEQRKANYVRQRKTKRSLIDLELEFFMGAVAVLDRVNATHEGSPQDGSCLPPSVWAAAIRGESIAEVLQK